MAGVHPPYTELAGELPLARRGDGFDLAVALQALVWAGQQEFTLLGWRCPVLANGELNPFWLQRVDQLRQGARALATGIQVVAVPTVTVSLTGRLDPAALKKLGVGGSWLLLDAPLGRDLKLVARIFRSVRFHGLTPVVLAPERNREIQRLPELIRYWLQAGAVCSLAAGSLAGMEGHGQAVTAQRLFAMGYGSCVHGFIRGGAEAIAPGQVEQLLEQVPASWRTSQAKHQPVTARARKILRSLRDPDQ